ncbi:MAG: SRPBCC domain-containing protein [Bacteroidota bacterium]
MTNNEINFPMAHSPMICPVFVHNEIYIDAPAERIWFWLTHITTWPQWYNNSSNIQVLNQEDKHLQADTRFSWRTFNTNIKSEVKVFEPNEKLAWDARGTGLHAYHAWLIIPQKEGGCKVVTEETQKGWLPSLGRWFLPKQLYKQHQRWLEGLEKMSVSSLVPK